MKNKKMLPLVLAAVLVVVIAVAGVMYTRLGEGLLPQSFIQLGETAAPEVTQAPTAAPAATDEPAPAQETAPTEVPAPTATPKPRIAAPDFAMLDDDGNELRLSDFFGKPIVLNFWASWCGPCKSEMPAFQAAWEQYGEDVHFLMVDMTDGARETIEVAKAFIQQQGYTFPVYFDKDNNAAIEYAVMSIPATYLIDEEGILVGQARGALNADGLAYGLSMILPEGAQ